MNIFVIILIVVIVYILIRFFSDLNKDNSDLDNTTLEYKFEVIVSLLNDFAYNGLGRVTVLDKRSFNLYEVGSHQIIMFRYGTGHLTIIWKYKYFQKEVVYEKTFENVRNLSIFEQGRIAELVIREMQVVIAKHQIDVMNF